MKWRFNVFQNNSNFSGEHKVLGAFVFGIRRSPEGKGTVDQNLRCKSPRQEAGHRRE